LAATGPFGIANFPRFSLPLDLSDALFDEQLPLLQ
jgi:hypothetical protein